MDIIRLRSAIFLSGATPNMSVSAATDMSEEERDNRLYELGELKKLSMPYRRADTIPYVMERYVARLKSGKNYYSQRPLHWDCSTVK